MRRVLALAFVLASCGPAATHLTVTAPTPRPYRDAPNPTSTPTTTSTTSTTEVPTTTTEPARPSATAASRSAGPPACGGWYELVASYDWPVTTACRILLCESKGDPDAVNASSGATGLFQILRGPSDPAENVALAYDMWSHRGWQPWVCR